jgi:hypothetical protein
MILYFASAMSTLTPQDIKLGMYLRVPISHNSQWYGIGKVVGLPLQTELEPTASLEMISGINKGRVGAFPVKFLEDEDYPPFEMTITYGGTYLIDFGEYGYADDSDGYPRVRQVHLG